MPIANSRAGVGVRLQADSSPERSRYGNENLQPSSALAKLDPVQVGPIYPRCSGGSRQRDARVFAEGPKVVSDGASQVPVTASRLFNNRGLSAAHFISKG